MIAFHPRQYLYLLTGVLVSTILSGCGSQIFAPRMQSQASDTKLSQQHPQPTGHGQSTPPPPAKQPEVLYVVYDDGCSTDQTGDCNASIFPFALDPSTGIPTFAGPGISFLNPISIVADKQRSKIALETWADSTGGWYSLQLYEAQSNGSLRNLAATALSQQSAIRFHPNGRWLLAGPGPLDAFTSVVANTENALDMQAGLELLPGSVSDLGFVGSDAVMNPDGVHVYAASLGYQMRSYTMKLDGDGDEVQLIPGHFQSLAGNPAIGLEPSLGMNPSGHWLYAQTEPGTVVSVAINTDGSLSSQSVSSNPGWLVGSDIDATGNYAFFDEQEFHVNPTNGSFENGKTYTENSVLAVQTDASGKFVYTLDVAPGADLPEVTGYSLDSTGKLTPLSTSPWTLQGSAQHLPVGIMVVSAVSQ